MRAEAVSWVARGAGLAMGVGLVLLLAILAVSARDVLLLVFLAVQARRRGRASPP